MGKVYSPRLPPDDFPGAFLPISRSYHATERATINSSPTRSATIPTIGIHFIQRPRRMPRAHAGSISLHER